MDQNSSRFNFENNDTSSFWGPEVPLIELQHSTAVENDTRISDNLGADDEGAMNSEIIAAVENQKRSRDDKTILPGLINNNVNNSSEIDKSKRLKRTEATTTATNVSSNNKHNDMGWSSMFDRLMAFRAQHGHCLVPKRYAADPQLGTWVETQRVQYKRLGRVAVGESLTETTTEFILQPNNRLTQERLERLQSIGFVWNAKRANTATSQPTPVKVSAAERNAQRFHDMNDQQWDHLYQRLLNYKERHGDTLVPKKYSADPFLAAWVEAQRYLRCRDCLEEGSNSAREVILHTMDAPPQRRISDIAQPDVVQALEADTVHPLLLVQDGTQNANTSKLVWAQPPFQLTAVEGTLANDAALEASTFPASDDDSPEPSFPTLMRLPEKRREKLDAIGFVWDLRRQCFELHWNEMFRQLVEYKHKHGDCVVRKEFGSEYVKLAKWTETQKYEYTKLQRAYEDSTPNKETPNPASTEELLPMISKGANSRLTEERILRLQSIGFEWKVKNKMKRYYENQWNQMFDRLLKFKNVHGHSDVPRDFPSDPKLGLWVYNQRAQNKKLVSKTSVGGDYFEFKTGNEHIDSNDASDVHGKPFESKEEEAIGSRLTEDRRKRLTDIGFSWANAQENKVSNRTQISAAKENSYDIQWEAMYERLRAFKEVNGHCLVPKRCKEDPRLGTWVDTQRVQYKRMLKKLEKQGVRYEGPTEDESNVVSQEDDSDTLKPMFGRLTNARIRKLEELGFVWSVRDDWQQHYEELVKFMNENGHTNVPARYEANRKLGIWVSAQRQQYRILHSLSQAKHKVVPLTQERIQKLNNIGFNWIIRSREVVGEGWNERYQQLCEFHDLHNHCNVPARYTANPQLGIWVGTQRTQYKLYMKAKEDGRNPASYSSMTDERIRKLENLGFIWSLRGQDGKELISQEELEARGISLIIPDDPSGVNNSHVFQQGEDISKQHHCQDFDMLGD